MRPSVLGHDHRDGRVRVPDLLQRPNLLFPLVSAATVFIPIALMAVLLVGPARSVQIDRPLPHLYVVGAISALALVVAVMVAVAAGQIGLHRVLLLALGFMAMGGLSTVHALATPGMLVSDPEYGTSLSSFSAFVSLFVPSLFFVASYLPVTRRLERHLPFWPAGLILLLTLAAGLTLYGVVALGHSRALSQLQFTSPPYSYAVGVVTVVLLLFAAGQQARFFRLVPLPAQRGLTLTFCLLAMVEVGILIAPAWSLAWWGSHLVMLAAVGIALWSLIVERATGHSLRAIMEGTLELEISIGAELEHVDTIARLAAAVEAKDLEIQGHNYRVAELAVAIGRQMGLSSGALRVLARSGLLHDVGKLSIPHAILRKAGPLDEQEWELMKQHPVFGVEIINAMGRLGREVQAVLHHHERVDGVGYPDGLAGDLIPLEARIIAVADTWDVMVSDRPYRKARSRDEAIQILRSERGHQLDGKAVDALLVVLNGGSKVSRPA